MSRSRNASTLERDQVEVDISSSREIPWLRVAAEGFVIVTSILLAFWIDEWSDRRADAQTEEYYLQLLVGDLQQNVAGFAEFIDYTTIRADAASRAYHTLNGDPDPDVAMRRELAQDLFLSTQRRTVAITRAAYTDLLSTGGLRLIRNLRLRDQIVRYYEEADRQFEVIRRNDALYVDGMAVDHILNSGLILGMDEIIPGLDVDPPDHPILTMPLDSEHLDPVRTAVRSRAGLGRLATQYAQDIIAGAETLLVALREELADR